MFNLKLGRRRVATAALALVTAGASTLAAAPPSPDAGLLVDLAEFRRLLPAWLAAERQAKADGDPFAAPVLPLRQAMQAARERILAARPATAAGAVALLDAARAIEDHRGRNDPGLWLWSPAAHLIAAALPALRAAHGEPA